MASMEITPSMMNQVAADLKNKTGEWRAAVKQIYQLQAELDAMWEGAAIEEFKRMFAEDQPQYEKLGQTMDEYQEALVFMADNYVQGDNEAKAIISRRQGEELWQLIY